MSTNKKQIISMIIFQSDQMVDENDIKGKAKELKGKIKGKTAEIKGKTKGKVAEEKGKLKGRRI